MPNSTYVHLRDFINARMRMSHIYQPVMLMTLLRNEGSASIENIAKEFLIRDQSQVEYYSHITKVMPGRVLEKNHSIVVREGDDYSLIGYGNLEKDEINELIGLCEAKLNDYIKKRGAAIYQHRRKSAGYIPGTLRYEILKQAKFRCELCGISADERALEVDHIVPRNREGSNDLNNLQSLCYSCNAMKRDHDDKDLRGIRDTYKHREPGCPFCEIPEERVVEENELAYRVYDGYPVTDGLTLVIPKRHIDSYFELGRPELNACNQLLESGKQDIQGRHADVSAFNIGINDGKDAGQTVFHCHIHLIPRRQGDVANPRGGVRGVIASKQSY